MLGLLVATFSLYLARVIFERKKPKSGERRLTIYSFCLLVPALLVHSVPLTVVSLISVLMSAYLHRAR